MKIIKLFITIFVIFTFVGCSDEIVVRGVDQKQANEIVSALATSDINSKVKIDPTSKKLFAVYVSEDNYMKSVSILTSKGLPRENTATFSELIAHHGILPDSKRMESLRLDKALALEIEEAISRFPNISNVSVVVRKEYIKDKEDPSVAILIVTGASFDNSQIQDTKNIVMSAIPGIADEDIKILIREAEPNYNEDKVGMMNVDGRTFVVSLSKFLGYWEVATKDHKSLSIFFVMLVFFVGVIGIVLGYYGYAIKNVKKTKLKIVEASPNNLLGRGTTKRMSNK